MNSNDQRNVEILADCVREITGKITDEIARSNSGDIEYDFTYRGTLLFEAQEIIIKLSRLAAERNEVIEECAKIADAWPAFVQQHGSETTHEEFTINFAAAVTIARKIRALSTQKKEISRTNKNFREVGKTPHGYTIFVENNEAGGRTYYSDEIGGGVMVWDTSLIARESIEFAFEAETSTK